MKRGILIAIFVAFLLLLLAIGVLSPVVTIARRLLLPVIRLTAQVTERVRSVLPDRVDPAVLTQCETRLRTLVSDETRLHTLEEENTVLRAQAKFSETSGYDQVGALVISRELGTLRGRLLIDRGAYDHVEVGQAVVTAEGIYIGHIRSVETRVATVELLSDSESRVAAATEAENTLVGVIEGRGNGAATLTYIPSSLELKVDQIIVTAGTGEKVPARLALGIVNSVTRTPKDPFYTASIDPLVRFDRLTYVSVLRPSVLRPSL